VSAGESVGGATDHGRAGGHGGAAEATLQPVADRVEHHRDLSPLQDEARCWCGARATHNARVVNGDIVCEGDTVMVGDTNPHEALLFGDTVRYELLCRMRFGHLAR